MNTILNFKSLLKNMSKFNNVHLTTVGTFWLKRSTKMMLIVPIRTNQIHFGAVAITF